MLLLFAEADPVDVPGSSLVSSKLRSSPFHFSAAIALVSVEHMPLAELDLVQINTRSSTKHEVIVCCQASNDEVEEGPRVFRCPWLQKSFLEVFRSRNPPCNEGSGRLGEGFEVERLPLRSNFWPVVFRNSSLQVVTVAQSVTDLAEHEDCGLLREVDLLDDRSSNPVRHFTFIPVCPQNSTMDVPPSKLRWNALPVASR